MQIGAIFPGTLQMFEWMRQNARRHRDRLTGQINERALVEAWWVQDHRTSRPVPDDHIAWIVAAELQEGEPVCKVQAAEEDAC